MRRAIVLMGVLGFLLAACGGGDAAETFLEVGNEPDGGQAPARYDSEGEAVDPMDSDEANNVSGEKLALDIAVTDRKVIRNVSLQLAADDTRAAYEAIVAIAEQNGGFVAAAEVSPTGEGEQPFVRITVRVPSSKLSDALDGFRGSAAEVLSESQGTDDVTESFIDLEAQLTNLTALETELRALLEEVREQPDADPDKLLRVFTEISNTRSQIEQIQGQLNYLDDAVALATVTMSIAPTPAAVPIVEENWAPINTVRDASRDLVSGLQGLLDTAITFVIAVLPMLLITVGVPAVAVYGVYRMWRSRRSVVPASGPSAPLANN
ncbi:MAG: DUF4349 domain-containing protein [Acidimicrobiia bacterium]